MPNEPGLTTIVAPGSMLLRAAAEQIVAREDAPNLANCVVVVPNLFAAAPLQQALRHAAAGAALLLPTITTLSLWVENIPLAVAVVPGSRRLAWVHNALREGNWFPGLDLWQVAAEVLALIDDCARHGVALPQDANDFQRVVRQALRAIDNHAVQFEARLVHELWRALQGNAKEIDRHGAYHLRLAELAANASAPLYIVGVMETTAAEDAFLQRYAWRQSVFRLRAGADESAVQSPLFALLRNAWCDTASRTTLRVRAREFADQHNTSPAGALRTFAASSLEQESRAVELTIRRWLYEGKRAIAIIAQDRLTARRVRARLERAQILVADESGWTLSTTTASSLVMRWLDLIGNDFYFRDLFDLLHSPFLLGETVRQAVHSELEKVIVDANYIGGLSKLRAMVERARLSDAAAQFIHALISAGLYFGRKPRTLSRWLRALIESFDQLGATTTLRDDAAGADLLRLLQTLAGELEGERESYSLSEWRRWLDRELENASFRDTSIESPVVLTHLGLTDGRRFDGVILLGADADHLPSPSSRALFNDAVLEQLGLPSAAARRELELQRLMQVLAHADAALVTWQAAKGNEPNPASSYWARLIAFHRVAYGEDLAETELAQWLDIKPVVADDHSDFGVRTMPRPSAPQLLPETFSASDYSSLIACPYQFFVRRMLAIREPSDVVEAMEKKDYGELVHRILAEFHGRYAVISSHDDAKLVGALHEISDQVFRSAPDSDALSRAWRVRWQQIVPAYLNWQRAREQLGWRWQASEVVRESLLELESGPVVRLRGRLDRFDHRQDGSNQEIFAVLDYKTGSEQQLKNRAAHPDEDGQLPFYAMLADPLPAELAYVALESMPIVAHLMAGNIEESALNHRRRLQTALNDIAMGKGLPAQGVDDVCAYCEAQGVCRKRYWERGDGD